MIGGGFVKGISRPLFSQKTSQKYVLFGPPGIQELRERDEPSDVKYLSLELTAPNPQVEFVSM